MLEWVATFPLSGDLPDPRGQTHVSCISRQILYLPRGKPHKNTAVTFRANLGNPT